MDMPSGSPNYLNPCLVTLSQAQALESFCRAIQVTCQSGSAVPAEIGAAALAALGELSRSPAGGGVSAGWSAQRSPASPQAGATIVARNTSGDELLLQLDYAGRAHIGSWSLYDAQGMIQQVSLFDLAQKGLGWTLRVEHDGQVHETFLGGNIPGGLVWTRQPEYPVDRSSEETPGTGQMFAVGLAGLAAQALGAIASGVAAGVAASIAASDAFGDVGSVAPSAAPHPAPGENATAVDMPPTTPLGMEQATVLERSPWRLECVSGPFTGKNIPLTDKIVIGRSIQADLRLDDERVSRQHAALYFLKESWWIKDLGSSNGTLVNNILVQDATRLNDGDEIRIGASLFRIQAPSLPAIS